MAGGLEIVVWALLVIASITDLLWGKIFNVITFPFLGLGLIARFSLGGLAGEEQAWLGVLAALLLFLPLYRLGALAAADVKLLMAVGAWTEPMLVLRLGLAAIVVGAVVGLLVLVQKIGLRKTVKATAEHVSWFKKGLESHRMPFAPAFLCAFFVLKAAEMQGWRWF